MRLYRARQNQAHHDGRHLLREFSDDEVEVVLAHELGHQVHHDIWKLIALSAPTSIIGLYTAHRLTPPILRRFGQRWGIDPRAAQLM
jgi:STE24 endopeptidase